MRIGLIQSGGIGDIVIALPIAKRFADQGHEVLWPIYDDCIEAFGAAAPYVRFLPLKGRAGIWMYPKPLALLKERGCDRIIPLASYIGGHPELLASPKLASIMKFDQYKYAITRKNGTCRLSETSSARMSCSDKLRPTETTQYAICKEAILSPTSMFEPWRAAL